MRDAGVQQVFGRFSTKIPISYFNIIAILRVLGYNIIVVGVHEQYEEQTVA